MFHTLTATPLCMVAQGWFNNNGEINLIKEALELLVTPGAFTFAC